MKKYLLFVLLLVLSQVNNLSAQTLRYSPDSLFLAPDTVCINQPVSLQSNVLNAVSYFWGFCSGYLKNKPTGVNLGDNFGLRIPTNIDVVYDSGLYYGFVINSKNRSFLRYNFGSSLSNVPTVTNFDSLTSGLPVNPTSLFILKDTFSHNWFIFVSGGFTQATSSLSRIDFGPHLSNPRPNIANFGNYHGLLDYPKGIFIAQDGKTGATSNHNWYGYIVNQGNSDLIRLDFSFNVSNTPLMEDLGDVTDITGAPLLNVPTDAAAIWDNGSWYYFVTNEGNSTVSRIDLGTGMDTAVAIGGVLGANLGNFNFRINWPSAITINKDCGEMYAYITDSTTSQLIGLQMPAAVGPYYPIDYNNVGLMNYPSGISSVIRDDNGLYAFITNAADSTLTEVNFSECFDATIPSYTEVTPPVYEYTTPGVYNIFFIVNQGLPTQEIDCKPITVLKYPPIYMNNDTTVCEGDTIHLYAISTLSDSIRWTATYNIDTTNLYVDSVRVYPDYSFAYPVTLYYPFGCIVDTVVRVHISRVHADAGPDRWISDGAPTTLGGPYTSISNGIDLPPDAYDYLWSPYQFLSETSIPNPVANPPYDFTYYLTVTEFNDTFKCQAKDTVVVHVNCADIVLPNAFAPNSESSATNGFGILNNQIIKLNYFNIYDRWGELVYQTTNPTDRWDGTYNGNPAPVGVYVWEADAFCASGKEIHKSGNVTLLR